MIQLRRVLAIACLMAALPAGAANTYRLDIKPQSLSSALQQFAEQSGLQVVYYAKVATGQKVEGVSGNLTAAEALKRLLVNTDLQFESLDQYTVAISSVTTASTVEDGRAVTGTGVLLARVEEHAETPSSSIAGKSAAAAGDADAKGIQEITVTAQKRKERLKDVPISISVLTGETLDATPLRSAAEVLSRVGGVSVTAPQPGNTTITIRGITSSAGTSSAAFYLDEAPFSFVSNNQLPDANIFDLERIEVLRGPQGTIYGANSLSGVVRILTNDPDLDDFQMKGRVLGSTTDGEGNSSADAALNIPLIDGTLALRAVAGYSDEGGFIDNPTTGRSNVNDTVAQNYRLKLRWAPDDRWDIQAAYVRSELENGGAWSALDGYIHPLPAGATSGGERLYDVLSLGVDLDLGGATLTSATSDIIYDAITMVPFGPGSFIDHFNLQSFSQELRLTSDATGQWKWIVGGFYSEVIQQHFQDLSAVLPGFGIFQDRETLQSYAGFGELTRVMADGKLEVTGGVRYFNSESVREDLGNFFGNPLLPDTGLDSDKITWRGVISYRPVADLNIYGSISTGFRYGLTQDAFRRNQFQTLANVEPDILTNYEMGVKGSVDQLLTYEVAAYYLSYRDLQQYVGLEYSPGFFIGAATNAGTAEGFGADASLSLHPTEFLSLWASLGWNGVEFDGDTLSFGAVLYADGTRIDLSPEWTAAFGIDYRIPLSDSFELVPSMSYTYRSEMLTRFDFIGMVETAESDSLGDLSANIDLQHANWTLGVFGNNLLNFDGAITPRIPDGFADRFRPRTIGIKFSFNY